MTGEFEPTDSLPTRPSLLGRLADLRDDRSWREFCLAYEERIRAIARRRGLQEADAQEVAQDVLRRVAQTIHDYRPNGRRGAFRSWLFQLTRWRASDHLRKRLRDDPLPAFSFAPRQSDDGPAAAEIDRIGAAPEVHRQFELEAQRYVLDTLLSRLERTVAKKHLQMFQMVMLDEVPVPRVAELFRTRPATIYVVNHRVLEKLRAEVSQLSTNIE